MVEDFMIDAVLKMVTSSENDYHEQTKSYTDYNILCYIGSRTPLGQQTTGKNTVKTQYNAFTNTEYEPKYSDIIEYNNKQFRVISDSQDTINEGHHYKILVERIDFVNS